MVNNSKFDEIKASGHLPSPKGVAIRVIELISKDDVTNQEIARAIKSDPALSSRVIKVVNARGAYQTRPIASIVDAVTVLGFDMVRQLVLGLSVMESSRDVACPQFDYQDFWAHSLLTAITAQNLVLNIGIGSTEEVFILGLLGQIGSLALATAYPQEYARILGAAAINMDAGLINLERAEFGFDHNQLTQTMLEDWGLPRVFQEVALHHEDPDQSNFAEDSRDWRLLHVLHIADYFSRVCLAQGPYRRKMMPKLMLIVSRLGVEMDPLAELGDKSVHEWQEWSKLCGIRSVEVPPFAELLEAVPLVSGMLDIDEELPGGAGTFYKLRVLLMDDDKAILLLVKNLLEKAGHTVVTATNGMEGLGMIKEFMPQLIITDWVMSEMDGIEFCKALRKNPAWRNIYVCIMMAQEGMKKLVEAFEAGANDYMNKPVSPKVLMARLRAAQRVVKLQEEMEVDRQHLHQFADELAAFNHRLRKQTEADLRIAATAFESQEGMMITDANGVILRVNHAFSEITGYTAEEAIGQKPRLLKSGRHDAAFYAAMWENIQRTGAWQGEIWNRRKDGEVYPEKLTITAVRGGDEEINHYVATLHDITARKKAEEQLRESEARYKRIALHLDNVREEERVRIARELHDEMGATLTALKMRVHSLASSQPTELMKFVPPEAEHMDKLVSDAINTMRHVVSQLMPTLLHDLGFAAAVEHYVRDFQKQTGIECGLALPEEELTLDENQSSTMFRILQESLNNVAKHAQATKVSILFIDRDHSLILLVKDNGVGFDRNARMNNTFGLLGIRERALMVNGKARISSKLGKGTQMLVSIPLAGK